MVVLAFRKSVLKSLQDVVVAGGGNGLSADVSVGPEHTSTGVGVKAVRLAGKQSLTYLGNNSGVTIRYLTVTNRLSDIIA